MKTYMTPSMEFMTLDSHTGRSFWTRTPLPSCTRHRPQTYPIMVDLTKIVSRKGWGVRKTHTMADCARDCQWRGVCLFHCIHSLDPKSTWMWGISQALPIVTEELVKPAPQRDMDKTEREKHSLVLRSHSI